MYVAIVQISAHSSLKCRSYEHANLFYFRLIDRFLVLNATFSNISAISWWPVLVVEVTGVPRENHRPWASNW